MRQDARTPARPRSRRPQISLLPRADSKPRKRPKQARAQVTVEALFEAFVRIWQRDGWDKLTTRAVALEAGVAVGTLYEYFPNKLALYSGYVRYCIESLVAAVQVAAVDPEGLSWQARIHRMLQILCGLEKLPRVWLNADMYLLEPLVAEPKHQRRAHEELLGLWRRVLAACEDLPHPPSPQAIETLHLSVWGGRRYAIVVGLSPEETRRWAQGLEQQCFAYLESRQSAEPEQASRRMRL